MGRLDRTQLRNAVDELDSIVTEVDHIEVTAELARPAGDLSESQQLRGDDAVHLAAAATVDDDDLVLITGDSDLLLPHARSG